MVACPCCRAMNETGPVCRRCKADLSLLFQLEADRAALFRKAQHFARSGSWSMARTLAEAAERLRHGAETRQLLACLCLAQRDFAGVKAWYTAAKDFERSQGRV